MPFLDNGTSSIEVTPGELLIGSGAQATWRVQNFDLAGAYAASALLGVIAIATLLAMTLLKPRKDQA